jgi:hypothetical protein
VDAGKVKIEVKEIERTVRLTPAYLAWRAFLEVRDLLLVAGLEWDLASLKAREGLFAVGIAEKVTEDGPAETADLVGPEPPGPRTGTDERRRVAKVVTTCREVASECLEKRLDPDALTDKLAEVITKYRNAPLQPEEYERLTKSLRHTKHTADSLAILMATLILEQNERGLLAAPLLDEKRWPEVEAFDPLHLHRESHRIILRAMRRVKNAGLALDVTLVRAELEKSGELERAGGEAYLAEILTGEARSANVGHYATVIQREAKRRQYIKDGHTVVKAAWNGVPDEKLDALIAQVGTR